MSVENVVRLLAFTVFMIAIGVIAAYAHDAIPAAAQPDGWKYPTACCSGIDCREVADSAISEPTQDRQTFIINRTGEQLIPNDARIRNSPDGRFHWCSVQGADDSRTICLFVPQPSG